ncbi:MAG TPA: lipopolysaccharide biosynthesis protein [Alphaproteobacteria bacterium]|nr:lipopolysaccharide biosynthesis protein [Alphaproteobacteria bacterium]
MAPHPGRSFIWALLESGGPSVLSLVVLFVIARLLGPTELGTAALALGFVQMLAIVPETLMHDALVQRADPDDIHFDTAFWTCLVIGISLATACFFGAPLVARLFDSPPLAHLVPVAALGLCFSGAGSTAIAVLRRRFMFKALAMRSLYGRLFAAIVAIVLAFAGFGVWALIAQYLIQNAVSVAFVWTSCPWRPRLRFDVHRLRELLSFGLVTMGTRIAWLSSARLFTVLVGYFLGVTAVGYLNVAQRVVDTMHDMLCGAIYNLALPTFARKQDDRRSLARAYHGATEMSGILVAPIFGGIAICAEPILALFVGDQWLPAVPVIQVLAIGALLEIPFLLADAAITGVGKPGYMFTISLLSLGFVVLAFTVYPPAGVFGAAAVWASRILICAPVVTSMLHRLIGRTTGDLVRDSWAPLVATGVMAATVWLLDTRVLPGAPAWASLMVEIPAGAMVYGAVIAIINREAFRRLQMFVASGIRGGTMSPEQGSP